MSLIVYVMYGQRKSPTSFTSRAHVKMAAVLFSHSSVFDVEDCENGSVDERRFWRKSISVDGAMAAMLVFPDNRKCLHEERTCSRTGEILKEVKNVLW